MIEYVQETLVSFMSDFIDPKKRVFLGYWVTAFLMAWVFIVYKSLDSKALIFNKKIWFSDSAKADYKLFIINKVLMPILGRGLFAQAALTFLIYQTIHQFFGLKPAALAPLNTLSDTQVALLFTFCLFILGDFSRFFLHWMMHKIPFLWVFHQVHHSARVLTPMTVLRTHPVEGLLFSLRSILVQSSCIASFFYLFGDRIELTTVLGASVFVFVFNLLGSNLRHSHVPIHYWAWLEKWLVSPKMHQVHHSDDVRHFDKNMGAVLSVWDRIFRCQLRSSAINNQTLSFGLSKKINANEHTLSTLYFAPFIQFFECLAKPLLKKIAARKNHEI